MQLPTDQSVVVSSVRAALEKNQIVLLVGGPGGSYGPRLQRDARFQHHVCTEASRKDASYLVPREIGCVLLSNHVSVALTKNIVGQCEHRRIPIFGTFRSTGSVARAAELAASLAPPKTNGHAPYTNGHPAPLPRLIPPDSKPFQVIPDDDPDEAAAEAALAAVDASIMTPTRASQEPPKPITGTPEEDAIRRVFADARAAIDLAEETTLSVIAAARDGVEASRKLARLQQLLNGGDSVTHG